MDRRLRLRLQLGAAVLLAAVGLAGASAPARGGEPPPAATPLQLALRHAPILRFDTNEQLLPISRDRYVAKSDLLLLQERRLGNDRRELVARGPQFATLPDGLPLCPRGFRECHHYLRLQGTGDRPTSGLRPFLAAQQDAIRDGAKPLVYWHWDADENALQYWFFYMFNLFTNWHASDWEQITLSLDPATGTPVRIGYSSHEGGQGTDWETLVRAGGVEDGHPVVYVSRGSHANYFSRGPHRVNECRRLGPRICRPDQADGDGRQLLPVLGYELITLDGTRRFAGDYGTGNFIKLPGTLKQVGIRINVRDPQNRPLVWDRPTEWLAGNGPPEPPLAAG
jgi:hypothetical protein